MFSLFIHINTLRRAIFVYQVYEYVYICIYIYTYIHTYIHTDIDTSTPADPTRARALRSNFLELLHLMPARGSGHSVPAVRPADSARPEAFGKRLFL